MTWYFSSIARSPTLRALDIEEIKSAPHAGVSHPFIERLIGTIRREYLDQVLFWNAVGLARKLDEFRDYCNAYRVHRALGGEYIEQVALRDAFYSSMQRSCMARLAFLFIVSAVASAVHAGSTLAPENIYAQKLVNQTIATYPDLLVVALHVIPPKTSHNVIIASNIGLIGKRADAENLKVINTGETLAKANKFGNRFEVEQLLHDASQRRIGAVATVFPHKAGDNKSQFVARAAKIRDDLEKYADVAHVKDHRGMLTPSSAPQL